MQIMRFVVFFIQENLYSNILANSIFYSLPKNKKKTQNTLFYKFWGDQNALFC